MNLTDQYTLKRKVKMKTSENSPTGAVQDPAAAELTNWLYPKEVPGASKDLK